MSLAQSNFGSTAVSSTTSWRPSGLVERPHRIDRLHHAGGQRPIGRVETGQFGGGLLRRFGWPTVLRKSWLQRRPRQSLETPQAEHHGDQPCPGKNKTIHGESLSAIFGKGPGRKNAQFGQILPLTASSIVSLLAQTSSNATTRWSEMRPLPSKRGGLSQFSCQRKWDCPLRRSERSFDTKIRTGLGWAFDRPHAARLGNRHPKSDYCLIFAQPAINIERS